METKTVTYMFDYFILKDIKNKIILPDEEDNVKLPYDYIRSVGILNNYINWLHSMIIYAQSLELDLIKCIKLIQEGILKGLNWNMEQLYIKVFLESLNTDKKIIRKSIFKFSF